MRGSLGTLLAIVGTGPGGFVDGLGGVVDEGLAQELRALEAPVHPGGVTATFGDGRDTAAFLQLGRTVVAISIVAKGGEQPRCDNFAGAGQGCEEVLVVGELHGDGSDLLVKAFQCLDSKSELLGEDLDLQPMCLDADSGSIFDAYLQAWAMMRNESDYDPEFAAA